MNQRQVSKRDTKGAKSRMAGQRTKCAQGALLLMCLAAGAQTAWAQASGATAADDGTVQSAPAALPTTTVTGEREATANNQGFVAKRATGATKNDASLIETPQAVSVVTQDQITTQGATSVAEALRYTSSVTSEIRGASSDGAPYLYSRGFYLEQFLDGARLPSDTNFQYAIPNFDPYGLDRIEVLHGPASVLYGQANPGGIANLVSKLPTTTPIHEVFMQTGSHGRAEAGFDLGGALTDDGKLSYRLTGLGLDTNTEVDGVKRKRVYIAPAITWRPDADTSLTVLAKYQRDPDVGNYNFVPAVGSVIAGPNGVLDPHTNEGNPNYDSHSRTQVSLGYQFEHRFDSTWTFRQNLSYNYVKDDLTQLFTYGFNSGTLLNVYPFENREAAKIFTVDNQGEAKFNTGAVKHTLTFGTDFQRVLYNATSNFGAFTTQDAYNPAYAAITSPAVTSDETIRQWQFGLYAQDQIAWGNWRALAGIRQDWAESDDLDNLNSTMTQQTSHAFTWRTGLVYLFDNGFAPYLSYAKSFTPQTAVLADGTAAKPTTAQQYEVGVKYQPKGYDSFITASLFDLRKQNVVTQDPITYLNYETGQIRSRGIELEGKAVFSDAFNVMVSYTYLSSVNTTSIASATTLSGGTTTQQGKQAWGIPRHSASVWGDYTLQTGILKGFGVGAGIRYMGESYDLSNTVKVPSVTLVDAALHYDTGKHWLLSLNGKNIFNRQFVSSCYSTSVCTFGDGAEVLATARYRW